MENEKVYIQLLDELDKYPHLTEAVKHYEDTDGDSEHKGCLPNLIVWIRQVLPLDIDPAEYFEMDDETAEDFYSWGHNSRWNHTFRDVLESDFEFCVRKCIDLAKEYGDYDIETYMTKETEDGPSNV